MCPGRVQQKKTDFVPLRDEAGSETEKARTLGVTVIDQAMFSA